MRPRHPLPRVDPEPVNATPAAGKARPTKATIAKAAAARAMRTRAAWARAAAVMSATVRAAAARPLVAMAAIAVTAAGGCGVEPTAVVDAGPAPVITGAPAMARIYLLRGGRLAPTNVVAGSRNVNDIMTALFKASLRPPDGLTTDLAQLKLTQVQLMRYAPDRATRNDPDSPVGLRMRVFVSGPRLSRTAMAQITCTARLRPDIWAVEIAHAAPGRTGRLKIHTCREYWDLAAADGHLPP
jgi:hypothetical protein